jgi:hypothetical protein
MNTYLCIACKNYGVRIDLDDFTEFELGESRKEGPKLTYYCYCGRCGHVTDAGNVLDFNAANVSYRTANISYQEESGVN